MGLDTKYRPKSFDEVIGQEIPVIILKEIIKKKKFDSAYFFSGPSGTGKTTIGRIFSKAVLCSNPIDGNPCQVCESCLSFQEEKNFGYQELDAATYGGKEDMVKLRDDAAFLSIGRKKIILLDECHDISKQGQDALLKQVEQCPDHLMYIFCTTEPEKIKVTLKKRCVQFNFSVVDSNLIFNRLKDICSHEGLDNEEDALRMIADRSKGLVRDSLKILEGVSYLGPITKESVLKISADYSEDILEILSNLGQNLPKVLETCKKVLSHISVRDLYNQMITMVCDSVGVLYGYEDFVPSKKKALVKLRDIHGCLLIEFMNYLISRDKVIDRVGIQGDIILLHYKFCSNGFKPQVEIVPPETKSEVAVESTPLLSTPELSSDSTSVSSLTHAELSKLSIRDRSRILREQKKNQNNTPEEVPSKIPGLWSLPKEERLRDSITNDEQELTPLECSHLLVGGRGSGI